MDPRVSTLDTLLRHCGDELRAVPRIGTGIDRTHARELLKLTPSERIGHAIAAARSLEEFHRRGSWVS